jgi:predicted nucleic-acid-binding Zn-ribbon protein
MSSREHTNNNCRLKMKAFGKIAFGVVAVLSLPVVLPIMAVSNMIDARHQKRVANQVSCKHCGKLLGEAAILESNRVVAEEWKRARAKHPGVRFRKIRKHHAICTECGQEYFYSNQGKTYLPVVPA